MRSGEFLDGIIDGLRAALPGPLAEFHVQGRAHMLKLWYREPRLHYEVWPVTGRELIEAGLHFEADQQTNLRLLDWFDPHIIELKAAVDGAVELEQWTTSWGHLYHVFAAPTLSPPLQRRIVDWLARLIPVAEPILAAALDDIGPLATVERPSRDWAEWRRRRERRRTAAGSSV